MKRRSAPRLLTFGLLTTPAKDIFRSNYHRELLSGIVPRIKAVKGCLKIVMMPSRPFKSFDDFREQQGLDGLLILTWRWIHPTIACLIETSRQDRVLVINDPVPGLRVNHLYTDVNAGMTLAVKCLVRQGRKKIGMLHGPWEVPFKTGAGTVRVPFIDTQLKVRGLIRALKSHRLGCRESWYRSAAANSEPEGYRAMKEWLREKDLPDAIVCGNDDLAFGALRAITEAGRNCPGDIAVIGFDDNERAKHSTPPLTTVRQPLRQMGRDAVDILVRKVRRPGTPVVSKKYLPRLVIRKTA